MADQFKYIKIMPALKEVIDPLTKKPIDSLPLTAFEFFDFFIARDQRFGTGAPGVRKQMRVEDAFKKPVDGLNGVQYAKLLFDDHKDGVSIISSVVCNDMRVLRQYYPFMKAWEDALDELPKAEEKTTNGKTTDVALPA